MRLRAEELVQGVVTIASPPLVYERLVEVINHPRSGAADVAKVIGEDQGLTGRLLKIVNSALFSFPRPIETVAQAVTIVGTSQIRDLALATSVTTMFKGVPEDLVDPESFWYHSLACGFMARTIGAQRSEDNVERFFVAGLLHDVGHLVLYLARPSLARDALQRARESGAPLFLCEREVIGCDHAQVGRALLDRWNFPGAFREAVGYHHAPRLASRFPVEAAATHLAEVASHALGWGRSGEARVPPFESWAWDMLGLDVATLPIILDEVKRQLEAAVHFMRAEAA